MNNLVDLTKIEAIEDVREKVEAITPSLGNTPFLMNSRFMVANQGDSHKESIAIEKPGMLTHIPGKKRVAVAPSGETTFEFHCGKFTKDQVVNAEEVQALVRYYNSLESGQSISLNEQMILNGYYASYNHSKIARLISIYEELERTAFIGRKENKILGLISLLGTINGQNVVSATNVPSNTQDTHSIFILNMNDYVNVLFPAGNAKLVQMDNPDHVPTITDVNGAKAREDHYWAKVHINFGIRAVGILGDNKYGCARLSNIQLYNDTKKTENTFRDPSVRMAFHSMTRSIIKSSSSHGAMAHCFVSKGLFEEMLNFYTNHDLLGNTNGIQFRPRFIKDNFKEQEQARFSDVGTDSRFFVSRNVVVHDSLGVPTKEIAL